MTCGEFLERLSDYRDGLLRDPASVARFEAHVRLCPSCARILAALDLGLRALRAPEGAAPSRAFRPGLERRLRAEIAVGDPVMPTHAGMAAAFLLVAAVGLLLYEGLGRRTADPVVAGRPASAMFPEPVPVLPTIEDVTLSPFAQSALEYHGQQAPLGTFAALTD